MKGIAPYNTNACANAPKNARLQYKPDGTLTFLHCLNCH